MSAKPWMRWHVDRYRRSPRVLAMSLAAQGAYRNLLDAAWENGGKLPNAPAILWRHALAHGPKDFDRVSAEVLPMFKVSGCGQFLTNDTLTEEWKHSEERMDIIRAERSKAGKKGAAAKWQNGKTLASGNNGVATGKQNLDLDLEKDSLRVKESSELIDSEKGKEKTFVPSPPGPGTASLVQPEKLDKFGITPSEKLADLKEIFAYYLTKTSRSPKINDFTEKKRRSGMVCYEFCLTKADRGNSPQEHRTNAKQLMQLAVDALAADDFYMGRIPGKTAILSDWEKYLFKNVEQLESWWNKAEAGERRRSA